MQRKYCDHYVLCAHQLEMKQRECIDLEERRNAQSQINLVVGSCEKNIHEARSAIHGLELRRTERNKDCVRKNIINAENIMDPTLVGLFNHLYTDKSNELEKFTDGKEGENSSLHVCIFQDKSLY